MATYKNPWHKSNGDYGPAFYTTDAKPKLIGPYQVYYRVQSSNPSARCYDYVKDGVCVTQRCGGSATIEQIEA